MHSYISQIIDAEDDSELGKRRLEMKRLMDSYRKKYPSTREWVDVCLKAIPQKEEEKQYIAFMLGFFSCEAIVKKDRPTNYIEISEMSDEERGEASQGIKVEAKIDRRRPELLMVFMANVLISLEQDKAGFIKDVLRFIDADKRLGIIRDIVGYTSEGGVFHHHREGKDEKKGNN